MTWYLSKIGYYSLTRYPRFPKEKEYRVLGFKQHFHKHWKLRAKTTSFFFTLKNKIKCLGLTFVIQFLFFLCYKLKG